MPEYTTPPLAEFTDAADALAQITELQRDNERLTARLAERPASTPDQSSRIAALESQLQTVTGERDTLRAENVRLKAEAPDFNFRVASEVAKLGIRSKAVETASGASAAPKLSGTEKVLAANGVSTLDELAAKRAKEPINAT